MYDYNKNVNVITTPNGDKVVTMNEQTFDVIVNALYDAARYQDGNGNDATARDLDKLRQVLCEKEGE